MDMPPVVRDDHSAPFFDAAARGVLLLRYSPSSGRWSAPSALVCSVTRADDLEWRPASGEGSLVSWTVIPGKAGDGASADVTVGLVELAEGVWLPLRLVDAAGVELRAGLPVRVDFVRPEGGEAVPVGRVGPV